MYIDLLTRIKNGQHARKELVRMPFSNIDMAIAELLAREGYIASAAKKGRAPKRIIEMTLRYEEGRGVIRGVSIASKPSRRLYIGYRALKPVRQGHGTGIMSTSSGIMTAYEARKRKLGGVLLFELW